MKEKLIELLKSCNDIFPLGDTFKGNHHIAYSKEGNLVLYVWVEEVKQIFWIGLYNEFDFDNVEKSLRTAKDEILNYERKD